MQHDLILKGARVIDPSQNHDGICDVAFADGRVSGFGRDLQASPGTQVRDMAGAIVTRAIQAARARMAAQANGNSQRQQQEAARRRRRKTSFG